jgi:hypothetical protein
MYKFNLFRSIINVIVYAFSGRLHFPRGRVGKEIILDGERWVIFREAVVDAGKGQPQRPGAVFRPRFHVAGMSVRQNIVFSLLPMWLILGLPGFRSKLWLYSPETGDSSGYYEWDTLQDADNYSKSMAMQFMTRRSVPGSVSFKLTPNE